MPKILFFHEDIPKVEIEEEISSYFITELIKEENKISGDISIIFCSDEYLLSLNKKYLNHDYYTDIITFDYCEVRQISGDIYISIDRVKENANKFEAGFIKELYRVIFHGVLHLLGYNDKTKEEKAFMRKKEDFFLEKFLIKQ